MRLLLLPGMDGTGTLFEPLLEALKPHAEVARKELERLAADPSSDEYTQRFAGELLRLLRDGPDPELEPPGAADAV